MKIVFVSNFYNHHQSALSEALFRVTGGEYRFIQTQRMNAMRVQLGWGIELPSFVLAVHDRAMYQEALALIRDADVVITGSAPEQILKERMKSRKPVFRYSERIYKNFKKWLTLPARFFKYHTYNHGSPNVWMLCASAYAASDYAKTFNYLGKCYRWGYFPQVKRYDDVDDLLRAKRPASILWVSRFIPLKHPEAALEVAKRLRADGYDFTLDMIGNGPMEGEILAKIAREGLTDRVHLLGSMTPDQVREHMEQSEIFLFTSDHNEGWGAVLNESMNSACAVVASRSIGSVPYLLSDEKNGMTYRSGRTDELYRKVKSLLDDPARRAEFGKNAYTTMTGTWNADVAAERFVKLAEAVLKGEKRPDLFPDGPGSRIK